MIITVGSVHKKNIKEYYFLFGKEANVHEFKFELYWLL